MFFFESRPHCYVLLQVVIVVSQSPSSCSSLISLFSNLALIGIFERLSVLLVETKLFDIDSFPQLLNGRLIVIYSELLAILGIFQIQALLIRRL